MRARKVVWPAVAAVLAIGIGVLVLLLATGKGTDEARAQTVRFQKPTEAGDDPFTGRSDVRGGKTVKVGSGPFGGTGSDLVCDRELLIRSLKARPDRLRAWAKALDIEPTARAVARYIRKLRPVTLTRDTRVTNNSYAGGRAVAYQAILQAGTAVLVDEKGIPRARCRCGNPLLEPVYYPEATCYGCPPSYEPPPPCRPYRECWRRYPDPPPVRGRGAGGPEPPSTTPGQSPGTQPRGNPAASFSPQSGTRGSTYTLSVSGFAPNRTLAITLTRPDGATESYSLTTDGGGAGSYTFPRTGSVTPLGTYTALIRDPANGDTATASTEVVSGGGEPSQGPTTQSPPPEGQGQGGSEPTCDPATEVC